MFEVYFGMIWIVGFVLFSIKHLTFSFTEKYQHILVFRSTIHTNPNNVTICVKNKWLIFADIN